MNISIYLDDEQEQANKMILPDDVVAIIDKLRKDGESRKDVIIRVMRELPAARSLSD